MLRLSESEYNSLIAHKDAIAVTVQHGNEVSTAPREIMAAAYLRLHGTPYNINCGSCVRKLYQLFDQYIKEYERG